MIKQRAEKNDKGNIIREGKSILPIILTEIGETYQYMNELDSAEFYARKSIDQHLLFNGAPGTFPFIYLVRYNLSKANTMMLCKIFELLFRLPNQPGREPVWACLWLMILLPKNMEGSLK